jgi:putative ABC transport system substrate-binding protein
VRRREFIGLAGAAASSVSWPLAAHAQTIPVVGFLHTASPDGNADRVRAFRQGLKETGFIEGQNVAVEYRWADNQVERLPALATELVRRQVAVIVVFGPVAAFAAKAATTTIPIVFLVPEDPARLGLVTSLARPGGNLTGVNFFPAEVSAKRLELLRVLAPGASRIAVFVDSANPTSTEATLRDVQAASRQMGVQIHVLKVQNSRDIDTAFQSFSRERPDGLMTAISAFLVDRRVQVVLQAAIHRVPAVYPLREFVEAGGLMSYGASLRDATQQVAVYAGRILKGDKPTNLPVVQASKLELVINHQTARLLGVTVPQTLLATADEVIE